MKKVIISVLLLACMTGSFAKSYLNFTARENISIFFCSKTDDSADDNEIYNNSSTGLIEQITIGATAEYLYKFDESPFAIGAKAGGDIGSARINIDISDEERLFNGSSAGWNIAPAFGFIYGDTTKKQITIYPIGYEFYSFTELKDSNNFKLKDSFLGLFKIGSTFSWQWGSKVYNGFEIGFNILLNPVLKVDGKNYFNTEGMGIDFHAAYKLTLDF